MDFRSLREQLLDFEASALLPADCLISWKTIAGELGISPDTLQRWCVSNEIELPKWGPAGRTTPVYLPRKKLTILRHMYFG